MIRQKWILVFLIGVIAQGEPQDFRLPQSVIPDHYKIKILTDLSDNFFYNGEVSIDFLVKSATNKIVLHSKNLKIFENETKLEEFGKFLPHTNEKLLRKPKEVSWGATEFRNRPKAEDYNGEFKDEVEENERISIAEKKKTDVDFLRYALYNKHSKESSQSSSSESSQTSEESSEEKGPENGTPAPGMGGMESGEMGGMESGEMGGMESGETGGMESGGMESGGSMGGMESGGSMGGMESGGSMGGMESGGSMGGMESSGSMGGMESGGSMGGMESGGSMGGMESGGSMGGMESGGSMGGMESGSSMGGMESGGEMGGMESGSSMGGMESGGEMGGMESGGEMGGMESGGEMGGESSSDSKKATMSRIKDVPNDPIKQRHEYPPTHTATEKTKYSTQEYTSVHTTTNEKIRLPDKNQNDKMRYTTTERMKHSTYTKNPQESLHTTRQPAKTHADRYPTTEETQNQNDKIRYTTTERMKHPTYPKNPQESLHTTRQPTKTHADRYPTTEEAQNHNDKIKYTTTERMKNTPYKYTRNPQEPLHTTRQPPRTHTERRTTTEVTHSETPEYSTTGHIKQQSTTHHTTMDDKIHFTTHPPVMAEQHSTTVKQDSTKQPPVEPVIQAVTQGSVMSPVSGFPNLADTGVKVPQESYSVLKHEFDTGNDFLVVHLDKPLNPGKKYRLYLNYQGVLTDTLTGFHRVPYLKRGSSKSTWLASTVFEPNEARSAFPCFDEPALKAKFDVTLGHDKKYTALSNMPLKTKTQMEGKPDWQWSEFETTPPMSTYTAAFLISDLEYLTPRVNYSESSSNVTYRFWSRPDVLYKTRYAMRIAPEMKNYLESILGVRDVLPKHDFVALPNFISSALENWGLYSFAEKNLLFTSGFSSIFSKFEITHVVGHEIAHMWFGNMVTPKWWDQIWLSEGFSNFFEILAADHVQPTWDLKTVSVIFAYLKVFTFDALHTSHPLVPRLEHPNDLNDIFDSITYQKGFYLVRMLNYTLGQEAFMNGVRNYLKDNLLSTVDENDLWNALTDSAHHENTLPADYHLKDIMYAWTRRTGYPIVDVVRDYDNHTANITQRRFVRSKSDYEFRDNTLDEEEGSTKWWIPLTYTTGSELNFRDFKPRVWLNPHDDYHVLSDMPSKSDFVLMNLDAAGLYRVNYDQRNWDLIISYLINENSSDISVLNRVQILDDLLDLARAGEISYERALDATSYLAKEKHFLPWKAALSNFDFILRMLRSTESNKSFKKFVRNMVTPRFEELGFESVRNEPLSDGLNRKQIAKWACKTGVRSCTRKSISLFKKWTLEKKPDDHNPIPSNLRSIVYCTAIENGGSKDWQFLWQRYLNNMVTDRTAILYGLGCSRSTRTLRKLLDWSIKETSGIKKQDTPTVFKSVVRNDLGFALAKTFLRERMGDLKSYIGNNPFYLPQMIESVAAKMNQPADLEELEELEQTHFSHLRSVPRSFRQAAERVRFNINWVEKNFKPIQDWLKKQRM